MAQLIAFLEKGEGRQPTITSPASYMLVIRLLRVLKGKILRRADVFCKKGVLKSFAMYTGKYLCCSHFLIKLVVFSMQLHLKKLILVQMFYCELCRSFRTRFFKYHQSSLKMVPLAININGCNASYQTSLYFPFFLRSNQVNSWQISKFFLVLGFSLPSKH